MTRDTMKQDWIIGMIQTKAQSKNEECPDIYPVGCAGRITSFSETEDGRFLITLKGISRFRILRETPITSGYRNAEVHWDPFKLDIKSNDGSEVDRTTLEEILYKYFSFKKIEVSWEAISEASNEQLITSLAMQCPFTMEEKQALLEAPTQADRANIMVSILSMVIKGNLTASETLHWTCRIVDNWTVNLSTFREKWLLDKTTLNISLR